MKQHTCASRVRQNSLVRQRCRVRSAPSRAPVRDHSMTVTPSHVTNVAVDLQATSSRCAPALRSQASPSKISAAWLNLSTSRSVMQLHRLRRLLSSSCLVLCFAPVRLSFCSVACCGREKRSVICAALRCVLWSWRLRSFLFNCGLSRVLSSFPSCVIYLILYLILCVCVHDVWFVRREHA